MMVETNKNRSALAFVVLMGIVSLFADMTYEGARSIIGPYLAWLGASGTVVGFTAGFGELVGYGLRFLSGAWADRTRRYWLFTFLGYCLNLLAVPLLALTGRWSAAVGLMIMERMGKAIRTPSRDAMLSHATHAIGRGWGFGLHEAMDQTGAVLGPLLMALVLYLKEGYRTGFALLLIPALLALGTLAAAWRLTPHPENLEVKTPEIETRGLPKIFWLYLAAAGLIAAGTADFPLIAYHFEKTGEISPALIPIVYAATMGVEALAALMLGWLFDRWGLSALALATALSSFFAPLAFGGNLKAALAGMALWGVGMGAAESVMKAGVAEMAPPHRRGTAYGVFNMGYGLFWFAGSVVLGWFYDRSKLALIVFSILTQLAAVPLILAVVRKRH
jgi:MFS family permease